MNAHPKGRNGDVSERFFVAPVPEFAIGATHGELATGDSNKDKVNLVADGVNEVWGRISSSLAHDTGLVKLSDLEAANGDLCLHRRKGSNAKDNRARATAARETDQLGCARSG